MNNQIAEMKKALMNHLNDVTTFLNSLGLNPSRPNKRLGILFSIPNEVDLSFETMPINKYAYFTEGRDGLIFANLHRSIDIGIKDMLNQIHEIKKICTDMEKFGATPQFIPADHEKSISFLSDLNSDDNAIKEKYSNARIELYKNDPTKKIIFIPLMDDEEVINEFFASMGEFAKEIKDRRAAAKAGTQHVEPTSTAKTSTEPDTGDDDIPF